MLNVDGDMSMGGWRGDRARRSERLYRLEDKHNAGPHFCGALALDFRRGMAHGSREDDVLGMSGMERGVFRDVKLVRCDATTEYKDA